MGAPSRAWLGWGVCGGPELGQAGQGVCGGSPGAAWGLVVCFASSRAAPSEETLREQRARADSVWTGVGAATLAAAQFPASRPFSVSAPTCGGPVTPRPGVPTAAGGRPAVAGARVYHGEPEPLSVLLYGRPDPEQAGVTRRPAQGRVLAPSPGCGGAPLCPQLCSLCLGGHVHLRVTPGPRACQGQPQVFPVPQFLSPGLPCPGGGRDLCLLSPGHGARGSGWALGGSEAVTGEGSGGAEIRSEAPGCSWVSSSL